MNDLSTMTTQTMSSLEIAKLTGKQHKNVMADIRNMLKELDIMTAEFSAVRLNSRNKEIPCYNLPKRETLILVSGYNIKMRAAIIDRWQELEDQAQPTLPYHVRRYLANAINVPKGHFAILPELCNRLIFPLDRAGYHLPENMLPDISFGRMFCKELRRLGYNTNALPKYRHTFEDGRVVWPKAYPNDLYSLAIGYLDDAWMPMRAQKYFEVRDKDAIQYIDKVFSLGIGAPSTTNRLSQ